MYLTNFLQSLSKLNPLANMRKDGLKQLALVFTVTAFTVGCASDSNNNLTSSDSGADTPTPTVTVRESGITVSSLQLGSLTVHSLTAPEAVFANATHIFETENSLVAVDTQFLLPNAMDMRAFADELGKPISHLFITHEHPDHFLGSEAFSDVPVYALAEVVDAIVENGQAEIDEKQADFGAEAIASTFVVPQVFEPTAMTIDGVNFIFEEVLDAEAHAQMIVKLPDHGVIATGDIVYSGVHLILAGQVDTWTVALNDLAATSNLYTIVLPGHGVPATPAVYDENIAWLAKAGELIGSVDNADDYRQGLLDAFPDLGMPAAIDFVIPFLFPNG